MVDPISDFIIKIKNGSLANKESVRAPYSTIKEAIANLLVKEGYLKSVEKRKKGVHKDIEVFLAYENGAPKITDLKRVSKPSKRVYEKAKYLRPFKGGYGAYVITTPKGLMTDKEAKKEKVGGEVLFKIW